MVPENEGGLNIDTSYILEVYFDDTNSIRKIKYKDLPNVPHLFSLAAFGSFGGRSLIIGGINSNGPCLEFDQDKYQVIPSLNENREWAASTFIKNKIVISGGSDYSQRTLDTIEILDMDESNHGSEFIESPSRLPTKNSYHTLAAFNDKLYVIGGFDSSYVFNNIWEGTFDSQENKIIWVETGLRLQKERRRPFSFVISNQIIIFGGCYGDDFVEIIDGNKLKQGPKVPFELMTVNNQAVLDRRNRIIITSNEYGLVIYDHQKGSFKHFPNFTLREKRYFFAAILQ